MSARFSIEVDQAQDLVRLTMAGFFHANDIALFAGEQDRVYRELRCPPNQHVTLVDMRDMVIQSQDSVLQFRERLNDPAVASRRIAFVYRRSLARLQIKRAADGRPAGFFDDIGEAEAWLLAD